MSLELARDDPWVLRGYGQGRSSPGNDRRAYPSNLRDVHRRYAEVTSADEVICYLASLPAGLTEAKGARSRPAWASRRR
jgi:hypothetical protein